MRKILIIVLFSVICNASACIAQQKQLTQQDTLRGTLTPERTWWDVLKYTITVEPDFNTKTIKGKNIITARAVDNGNVMQIDLQQPMELITANCDKKHLPFTRNGNVYYLKFNKEVKKGSVVNIELQYQGRPREATNPPWDGGWIWKKDSKGNQWMSVACQLLGASSWYPCKDHQSDEPESAELNIVAPNGLIGVGNGRLKQQVKNSDGTSTYTWVVTNPINNYNIVPYIGKYMSWSEIYQGEKGKLDCSYWVLEENEKKAREQFKQVPAMLKCFEYWFGPYPFYEDGYKLVESPHLGMEHQSAVAYGNKFANGYLGKDLSETGWGKKWDFIIVHESGHEWFGNNITSKDVADMWIHEGFTNYSEALFTQCEYGKEAGDEYCRGLRKNIDNDIPLIGKYGVNKEGSGDMYYKGANLVHTIRQIMNDDEKFRQMLRGLNKDFYHQTVTTRQIENYISKSLNRDLSRVFDQYLRTIQIPVFEYSYDNGKLNYRWGNCIQGFDMPVRLVSGLWLEPTDEWKTTDIAGSNGIFSPDPNFYVDSKKM